MFCYEFFQIFQGTFLEEHLRVTVSTTKYPFVRWGDPNTKMLLSTCFFLITFEYF